MKPSEKLLKSEQKNVASKKSTSIEKTNAARNPTKKTNKNAEDDVNQTLFSSSVIEEQGWKIIDFFGNEVMTSESKDLDETYVLDDYDELPPDDIIAYNELRSCADLFRMYVQKDLDINPDFQRNEVWPETQKTRFIDSLIKKLPIPSMCFSLDYKTEKWQVIDGLQRITSIIKFLDTEKDWKLSKLDDIDYRLSGHYVSEIREVDKGILFTRLANLTIPITVLRCDYTKSQHTNYLFTIFHRLNTGGVKLTNQEIRNAIFNGSLNTLLKDLNRNENWRAMLGLVDTKVYRLSKEELILRFFAFFDFKDTYESGLSKFLNNYMSKYKNPKVDWLATRSKLFADTVTLIYEKVGNKRTLSKTSNVFIEALLVGVAKNIATLNTKSVSELRAYYSKLLKNEHFSESNLKEGLANKQKVLGRLNASIEIFAGK